MTAERGLLFILKKGNGALTEVFTAIAGMRSTSFTITGESVDITSKDSGGARQLLSGAGVASVSVSGSGVFTDSAEQKAMAEAAISRTIANYEVIFENGDKYVGAYQVTSFEFSGEHNGEMTYSATLESAGAITFMPSSAVG